MAAAKKNSLLGRLGPGLITGAADDDPSGIATYSQAGAQFGLNMLWTIVITYPLMVAVQLVSARIGRVTGAGLAANLRQVFPPWAVGLLVALLFVANAINIGADVAAMGAAALFLSVMLPPATIWLLAASLSTSTLSDVPLVANKSEPWARMLAKASSWPAVWIQTPPTPSPSLSAVSVMSRIIGRVSGSTRVGLHR